LNGQSHDTVGYYILAMSCGNWPSGDPCGPYIETSTCLFSDTMGYSFDENSSDFSLIGNPGGPIQDQKTYLLDRIIPMGVKRPSEQENISTDVLNIFPNPFNPSTTISFPKSNLNVDIFIYDVRGREVKKFSKVKSNRVTWDASSFTAGIYQVKVRNLKGIYTKSISLIK